MLFVDYDTLSSLFIGLWHIVTFWFLVLVFFRPKYSSYFQLQCAFENAETILIEKSVASPVYLNNMGTIVDFIHKIQRVYDNIFGNYTIYLVPVHQSSQGRYIEFECVRYLFDPNSNSFTEFSFKFGPTYSDLINQKTGLSATEAFDRLQKVGPNEILFAKDTFYTMIVKEFSGLFYVYQMMSLWIWFYYAYYYMAAVLTLVIISSGISKVLVNLLSQKRVLEMVEYKNKVNVLRNNEWTIINTSFIVPGDLIEITCGDHVSSVDAVLIDGCAVVDESSLTGEALPVAKYCIRNEPGFFDKDRNRVNSLFAGCRVYQVQPEKDGDKVTALVIGTGSNTIKGKLVRDILFPTKISFVFNEHLKLVFVILILWGLIVMVISIAFLGSESIDSWFYGFDYLI